MSSPIKKTSGLKKKEIDTEETCVTSSFEKLLEGVVPDGRYQWTLILLFLLPLSLCYGMALMNYILLMSTPKHHCHVPGRSNTNFTQEEWNNLTIPWEEGSDGLLQLSRCKMNIFLPLSELYDKEFVPETSSPKEQIDCQHGWDYDSSSWKETPVTKFNWVCSMKNYVTIIFTANLAGSAVGTLILPTLSDRFGRKPMFYVALFLNIIFANAILFAENLTTFAVLKFFGQSAFYSIYQLSYIIVTELCSQRLRNISTFLTWFMFFLGNFFLALAGWLLMEWKSYLLVSQLPLALFILYWRFIPESPRWLLSRGKLVECEKVLTKIATINGSTFTDEMRNLLKKAYEEEKKKVPPTKLFTQVVLLKHLILISLAKGLGVIGTISVNLIIHRMKGNIFLNYIILRSFEFPGILLSTICSSFLGRRLNTVLCTGMAAVSVIAASMVLNDAWKLAIILGVSKIFLRANMFSCFIQTGELFPTPLRATAYGFVGIASLALSVTSPSLVALGDTYARLPYYITGGLCITSALFASFLPETLGYPLPQTMQDAKLVGKGQSYFSCLPNKKSKKSLHEEEGKLNAQQKEVEKNLLLT